MTGIFGGVFDPPHNGHVALVEAAWDQFDLDQLVVLVAAVPGHKSVHAAGAIRMRLAEEAFPGSRVQLDLHSWTVDMLRDRAFEDPIFLMGADEFAAFPGWKDPDRVLELTRLGVATRPGYAREKLDAVLAELGRPERVEFFEIEPFDISSTEIRARVARGRSIDELVPEPVLELIEDLALYRPKPASG
jgi:nicotinate-nucleotide adenylyltransferase